MSCPDPHSVTVAVAVVAGDGGAVGVEDPEVGAVVLPDDGAVVAGAPLVLGAAAVVDVDDEEEALGLDEPHAAAATVRATRSGIQASLRMISPMG